MITVSLVEDDSRVRESLSVLINGSPGLRCVASFGSAEAALPRIIQDKPDVTLMDIHLPEMSGIDCVRRIKAENPAALILMLTVYEEEDLIFQALKAGASGYLVKQTPPAELLDAIVEVHAGGAPMSGNIARKVIRSFHEPDGASSVTDNLSRRERQILELLAQGYLYKEIADELSISFDTVNGHIRNIYSKLQVRSRTQAVARYLRR